MSPRPLSTARSRLVRPTVLAALLAAALLGSARIGYSQDRGDPWDRHVIDGSLLGADGARMDDVNGDGFMDIATGWEESGVARAYINPGPDRVDLPWPAVTVGAVGDVEDAVFVDLDDDGAVDVVTCAEGDTRQIIVHWAPVSPDDYLDPSKWHSATVPASAGWIWMFAVPMEIDGVNGIDLVAGGKLGAPIGWFESPAGDPRDLSQWLFHEISAVDWTMSLIAHDMDGDSDLDVVVTDRFDGAGLQGARWLENPGAGSPHLRNPWPNHVIGAHHREAMLTVMSDLDRDGLDDLVLPIRSPAELLFIRRLDPVLNSWQEYPIAVPDNVGTAKATNVGDIDLDGDPDIVVSFAEASGGKSGIVWMSYCSAPTHSLWEAHEISGSDGEKFDLVALLDLDSDSDLDLVTTEEGVEGNGLGLIWYANPTRTPIPGDFDHDNDVDQTDFGHLQACLSGSDYPQMDPDCTNARLDEDEDVDQVDLDIFRQCLTGANVPADPDCGRFLNKG